MAQNMLYISQIQNFSRKHSDMLIYKTLEKSWILKTLRKESIFLHSKRHFFSTYRGVYFFSVANFRVTLRDRAHIFLKKATIYENDRMWYTIFSSRIKRESWKCEWKNITYFVWCLLQCNLNKVKINYLEEC